VTVTIYHNPNCGTSRNVLAMIRQSGEEPVVIEYLKTPPTRERLKELIAAMGIPVRALLREKGTPYSELGLGDPKWTDEDLGADHFDRRHKTASTRRLVQRVQNLGFAVQLTPAPA
jgi:arsenate reductase (glutaredoxin)